MLNALGAAVWFLLLENPFLIEYSGFWFSVSALIGVGFVGTTLSQLVERGKGVLMSVGITITTIPIVAYCYYEIPLYSPLVNFILLPILTPIFVLALAGGFVGLFCLWAGALLLLPCEWGLSFYEWVCQLVAKLPCSIIITGIPSTKIIVVYYIVLCGGTLLLQRRKKIATVVAMTGVCITLLIYPKPHEQEITFLDVGQGDGIYISTGDGVHYFIDGGSTDEKNLGKYYILPFLKSNAIEKIDYWFVTHADTDHISGLLEVMESGYSIEHLVVAEAAPEEKNMLELIAVAKQKGVDIVYMEKGDSLCTEGTRLTCLYPSIEIIEEHPKLLTDKNETSLVLEFVLAKTDKRSEFRSIFTGDISAEVEDILLEQDCLQDVDLYKVAHHGSKNSSSEEFLAVIQPELAVVSCGKNNRYGHPAKETIERVTGEGAEIFYTMDVGQITIKKGLVIPHYLLLQYSYENNRQ